MKKSNVSIITPLFVLHFRPNLPSGKFKRHHSKLTSFQLFPMIDYSDGN